MSSPPSSSSEQPASHENEQDNIANSSFDFDDDTSSEEETKKWKVHETPQDAGVIPTVGVTLWLGWMGFLIYLGLYLIFFGTIKQWMIVLGIMTASIVVPRDFPAQLGFQLGDWMMSQAEKYFGLKTTIEDEEALLSISNAGKASIFALEPHDILPYPIFSFSPSLRRIPGGSNSGALMTSSVFYTPFIRQVYTWVRGHPIDKKTFKNRLLRSQSSTFIPGGVQEVTMMDPSNADDVLVYIKSRKGFVKIALTTGSPIVPAFAFNTDGSYGYWIPKGTFMTKVARKIGFAPMVFWGRFGIPFGIPRPRKIHVVVGKPIYVPKEEEVTMESVQKYHALFLKEVEALYDRHKDKSGYGHRQLKIV